MPDKGTVHAFAILGVMINAIKVIMRYLIASRTQNISHRQFCVHA